MSKRKYGIRELVKLAEDHALGILESTDDLAFWGDDFFDSLDEKEQAKLTRAKKIIMNRIGGKASS